MAFAICNLSVVVYVKNFTMWHYKSDVDDLKTISGDNYFLDAYDTLREGDLIVATRVDGARIVCVVCAETEHVATAPLS